MFPWQQHKRFIVFVFTDFLLLQIEKVHQFKGSSRDDESKRAHIQIH